MTVARPMPSHFGKNQPRPGVFTATCVRVRQPGHTAVAFSSEDRNLFEQHMHLEHNRKKGRRVWTGEPAALATKPLWRPPALSEEGKAFEPTGLDAGAEVTWKQWLPAAKTTGLTERSGQVWCAGYRPKSVWVVPFELLENEVAVMLEELSSGVLEHHTTMRRQVRSEQVAEVPS